MAYEWRNNPACVATYKILEGDHFLDLFDEEQFPFATAGPVTMAQLHIRAGASSTFDDMRIKQYAKRFVTAIEKNFTTVKEDDAETRKDIVNKVRGVFSDNAATICRLAEVADGCFSFPNEA